MRQWAMTLLGLKAGASTLFRQHRLTEVAELKSALRTRDDTQIQYLYYRLHYSIRDVITAGEPDLFPRYLFMAQPEAKQRLKEELISRCDRAQLF